MTISAQNNRISYAGNGTTTAFSYPAKFLANADLVVILKNAAGTETVKTLTTHYTVTGAGDAGGGTVTMLTAPASGETLIIYNDPAITQPVDLVEGDALAVETQVETPLDRLTLIARRLSDRMDRAFHLSSASTFAGALTIPEPGAGEVVRWNLAGNALETVSLDDVGDSFLQSGTGAVSRSFSAKVGEIFSVKDFGAVGDGVTDDTAAFEAALAAASIVLCPQPAVSYRWNSTLNPVSGRSLIGMGGQIPIQGDATALISMSGITDFVMEGFVITGPHSGTDYQVTFASNAKRNKFRRIKFTNGNSGIDVTDSQDNEFEDIEFRNMRGTGMKFSGSTTKGNIVRNGRCINGSLFGFLIENDACDNAIIDVDKRLEASTVTAWQTTNDAADLANGRIGLECVGIRIGCDRNTVSMVRAYDCGDNGVSITGAENAITNVTAVNNDNDGVHIYGSNNALAGINCRNNAQTGLGISRSSTTGDAAGNVVTGLVSQDNTFHGVYIGDVAVNNMVLGHVSGNGRGPFEMDATTKTTNRIMLNGHWSAQSMPVARMNYGGYNFDGSTTYLDGNAYTGITDTKTGTIFAVVSFDNAASATEVIHDSTGNRFQISRTSTGGIRVVGRDTTPAVVMDISTTGFPRPCSAAGTYSILISYDLATPGSAKIWVNDQPYNVVETTFSDVAIDYTTTENSLGGGPSGSSKLDGDIHVFWFTELLALGIQNETTRRAFMDANGTPVWLGANGEVVTGSTPIVFHAYDNVVNWPVQRGRATSVWVRNGSEASVGNNISGEYGNAATVIKTVSADYTVQRNDRYIINDRAATNTLTLPDPTTCVGRQLTVSTIQAQQVDSASSNVIPRAGGAAGTAIVPNSDGAWADLVATSGGWQIMRSS